VYIAKELRSDLKKYYPVLARINEENLIKSLFTEKVPLIAPGMDYLWYEEQRPRPGVPGLLAIALQNPLSSLN
jgi:hypothetical protein